MTTSHPSHCGMSNKGCVDSPHSWGLSGDKQVHMSSPYSDFPCHCLDGGLPTHPAALIPAVSSSVPHRVTGQLLRPFPITDPNTTELLNVTYTPTSYTVQKANYRALSSLSCLFSVVRNAARPSMRLANKLCTVLASTPHL